MIIRLRCRAGTWRVPDVNSSTTIGEVKARVEAEHKVPAGQQRLTSVAGVGGAGSGAGGAGRGGGEPLPDHATLGSLGLGHGDMLQLDYDASIAAVTASGSRVVAPDGKLVSQASTADREKQAFRPGLMRLRDMKMHWTLTEMTEMAAQYEFKIKRQEASWCKGVQAFGAALDAFQNYLRVFSFTRPVFAVLYGKKLDDGKVQVEAVYEVPQTFSEEEGLSLLDDEDEDRVEKLASMLGLERVGIMFSHAPRVKGFNFTADEILTSAAYQMEAGEKSTFVTIKVTLRDDGTTEIEAFQVSDQCVEMMSRDALAVNPEDPKTTKIDSTFTAIVEAKEVDSVDNDFFLVPIPIEMFTSKFFATASFPAANREMHPQVFEDVADHLRDQRAKRPCEQLADFQLLLFLAKRVFDMAGDMPAICEAVVSRGEIEAGHMLILKTAAGIEI